MSDSDTSTRFAFTKKRLDALPVPEAGRRRYRDEKTPGLCLTITAAGVTTFYWYRKVNGTPEEIPLGRYPATSIEQARDAAAVKNGKVAVGKSPAEERRASRKVPTLKEAFEHWRDTHAKLHRRTWKDDQRQFDKYLVDFHNRRLNTIRTGDVAAWHGRIGQENGPYQANRALELLRTIINRADRVGYSGKNPAIGIQRFKEPSRDRFLHPQEMGAFYNAIQQEEEPWRDFYLLLLFTGARRANVCAMRFAEIDFHGCVWRIPRTKNDQPQYVPLVPPAMRILEARRDEVGQSQWVFPSPGRTGHITSPRKSWERVLERAGLADLRLHDLRRSLGSWQAAAGASIAIIGASLGHRDLKSTQVYSRLQLDAVRQSVERATTAMLAAATPKQLEVDDHGEA